MARTHPEIAKKLLGLQNDGKLSRCPENPNCVCSVYEDDSSHFIKPIHFRGMPEEARKRLKSILLQQAGYKIAEENENYMRVEVTSELFKFVDDVEFHIQAASRTIQFRSASRLGYWDLGANRRRMKNLIQLFERG